MGIVRIWRLLLLAALAALLVGCKPIPSFSFNPDPATAGVEITFDGSGSMVSPKPQGNTAVSFVWDFGDGQSGSGKVVRHTYARAGDYKLQLTVTDAQGRVGSQVQVVKVQASSLVAGPVRPVPAHLWQPAAGSTPTSGNYVFLQSQEGDYIGQGRSFSYTQKDAELRVSHADGQLSVSVAGAQSWSGEFKVRAGLTDLQPGYYPGLTRYPFHDTAWGGLSWGGEGRGCNTLAGWFVVDSVRYAGGALQSIDLRFEQHCEGGAPALNGKIHWDAADTSGPSGPIDPPPADLWQPPAGATPASGNYVYLQSDAGDYIGQGQTTTLTQANNVLTVSASAGLLSVQVQGNERWSGNFKAMNLLTELKPGYYPNLGRYPFHNPTTGGLEWSGAGRGCNTLTGWFVVDRMVFEAGALKAVDLRFEQHCEGAGPALRGKIHWDAADTTGPSGPIDPPANLWQPPAGATPASGNYVYLQSDAGDYIGQGQTSTFTQANAVLAVSANAGLLRVQVQGRDYWTGSFKAMNLLTELKPGYYPNLGRYPFHNPTTGGLDWSGAGRGCNTLTGWFVVDRVVFQAGVLTGVDLRFEQHCEGAGPALRGKIRWDAGDTTAPSGPQNPPPAGLWTPGAAATPASGNYVYLSSEAGDYIGQGANVLYTPDTASLSVSANGAGISVAVSGPAVWSGSFVPMNSLQALQPGYYGNLSRFPFHNPTLGGLSWSGEGRGCNTLKGWFVVDSVAYDNGILKSINLRFSQNCEGGTPALRGQIRWVSP